MHSSTSSYKHSVGTLKYAATFLCHSQSSTSAAVCGSISEMDSTAGDRLRWRIGGGGMSTLHYRHFPTCAVLDVRSSRAYEHVHKVLTLVHEPLVKYM